MDSCLASFIKQNKLLCVTYLWPRINRSFCRGHETLDPLLSFSNLEFDIPANGDG